MTQPSAIPLCVDLDGTLIRTDMFHESLLSLAKTRPLAIAALPAWLSGGKAALKHRVAERFDFDPSTLPYREEVLALIAEARAEGRPIVLATAASHAIAEAISQSLGLFDAVLSSDDTLNMSARHKAEALVARYGEGGFDYIGNHRDDLPVLARARRGWLVSSNAVLRSAAGRDGAEMQFIDAAPGGPRTWFKAIRAHQWLKNALVFVPLVAGHEIGNLPLVIAALLAFAAFSLCASGVYILNDLLDLAADRQHRSKRRRPFASGKLPVAHGMLAAPLLLAAALAIALTLPPAFLVVLAIYAATTTAYSFWLKRQVIVDVMMLAGLYTLRVLAGSAATMIVPSFWLLAFSMFIFLCLAMVKRYSELRDAIERAEPIAGRGYTASDLPVILAIGAGSGLVSVLVLALYTQMGIIPEHTRAPEWLWLVPPLMLYWVARLWLKAGRGEIDDDPVLFAARDWQSIVIVALMGGAFVLGSIGWWPF